MLFNAVLPSPNRLIFWLRNHPGFCFLVLAPTLIAVLYFGVIASDRYTSEVQLTVKQSHDAPNLTAMGLGALLGSAASSREDVHYLKEHILSQDMLNTLEKKMGYRNAVSGEDIDWFSRLPADASQEEVLAFYRAHTHVRIDESTGILTLKVEGFTPQYAYKLSQFLSAESERFINNLSHKIANEQVDFVAEQLSHARQRLDGAKQKLLSFQNKHGMLDPAEQAKATAALMMELQNAIAQTETEYRALTAYVEPSAPQAAALQQKISALKTQLEAERNKVAGKGNGKLNTLAASFMELEFNAQFAHEVVKSSLAALEKTRVEAAQKLKHVVQISEPHPAQDAEYPKRFYNIAATFVFALIGYWIARLLRETIIDHRD